MKKALLVVLAVWSVPCLAQTSQPPKPGPEQQAMQFFSGSWSCEVTDAAKATYAMSCEMTAGGFFSECRIKSNQGEEVVSVTGYRSEEKTYTWFRYWNTGWADSARGWLREKSWTFVFENELAGGKLRRRQVTMSESSPDSWTFKWERSVEGGPWQVTQEGKCTKTK